MSPSTNVAEPKENYRYNLPITRQILSHFSIPIYVQAPIVLGTEPVLVSAGNSTRHYAVVEKVDTTVPGNNHDTVDSQKRQGSQCLNMAYGVGSKTGVQNIL
uniref:Amidase domain-containing protein n=1 Tax=Heterorhabditis bacteriophora TaxID=37862 RepID=A0A1I7XUY9_HETBA